MSQPMEVVDGVVRFRANPIVRDLLDAASKGERLDLNEIWLRRSFRRYTQRDMRQFYQLIGYSVSGYGDMPLGLKHIGRMDAKADGLRASLESKP